MTIDVFEWLGKNSPQRRGQIKKKKKKEKEKKKNITFESLSFFLATQWRNSVKMRLVVGRQTIFTRSNAILIELAQKPKDPTPPSGEGAG